MSDITIHGVTKTYRSSSGPTTAALAETDLQVAHGSFTCLLGPSGCGKTTLLNLVAGFLEPSQGFLEMDGGRINGPGPERGVVFQEDALFPWATAERNVAYGPRMKGVAKPEALAKARQALDLVGLKGFEKHLPKGLSGGMKQRAAIARVLVNEPHVMLFDEPFSALDAFTRESLQKELIRIWHEQRLTILFVTHNVEEALTLGSRVLVMGTTPFGGVVLKDIDVDLTRPRDTTSTIFNDYKRQIMTTLNAGGRRTAEASS